MCHIYIFLTSCSRPNIYYAAVRIKYIFLWDFSGGPVTENPLFYCRGHGGGTELIPGEETGMSPGMAKKFNK